MNKNMLFKFILILVAILSVVFLVRFAYLAQFNSQSNSDFVFNSADNIITNLDSINATSQGLFKFFQSMDTYFNNLFTALTSYNVFEVIENQTKDIWVLGAFFNFMSAFFTILVYLVSLVATIFNYLFDIVKYLFTIETIKEDKTIITIPNVG